MRIDVHIYISEPDKVDQVLQTVNAIQTQLGKVFQLTKQEATTLTELEDKVTALEQKVSAESDVITSSETLLNGLSQMLKDALAAGNPAAVVARLQAISDSVDAKTSELAAAVTANTPAA